MTPAELWPIVPTGAGLWLLWKARVPVQKLLDTMTALERLAGFMTNTADFIDRTDGQLATIQKEVTHNGGGSIKDAVTRIELRLAQHEKSVALRFDNLEKWAEASDSDHESRLAALENL